MDILECKASVFVQSTNTSNLDHTMHEDASCIAPKLGVTAGSDRHTEQERARTYGTWVPHPYILEPINDQVRCRENLSALNVRTRLSSLDILKYTTV